MAEVSKSFDAVMEHTRAALARVITNLYVDEKGNLSIYLLDTAASAKLLELLQFDNQKGEYRLLINVNQTEALINAFKAELANVSNTRIKPFILCVAEFA